MHSYLFTNLLFLITWRHPSSASFRFRRQPKLHILQLGRHNSLTVCQLIGKFFRTSLNREQERDNNSFTVFRRWSRSSRKRTGSGEKAFTGQKEFDWKCGFINTDQISMWIQENQFGLNQTVRRTRNSLIVISFPINPPFLSRTGAVLTWTERIPQCFCTRASFSQATQTSARNPFPWARSHQLHFRLYPP